MQDSGLCKVQAFAWAKPKLTPAIVKSGAGKQILRIMKLTSIIILTACLQASAVGGYSQKISLSVKNAPLEQVFKSIEKQSGFYFNYMHEQIKQALPVTMQVKDASLDEVLAACFKGQPLEYSIVSNDKLIIIKEKKQLVFAETQKQDKVIDIDVEGRVVDKNGNPIPGATVTVQGTKKSVITDTNGEFKLLDINQNAIIQISHVQYEIENISLNGNRIINTTLQIKVGALDELQVIAYGTTTRRFSTGNISTVKSADIERQPVNNPLLALEGRVPGLFITQSSGLAGGGIVVRIQGQNSFLNGSDPLYIIDGVQIQSQLPATGPDAILGSGASGGSLNGRAYGTGNPLNYIVPNDIESIVVLKDADATAIYGSKAANGAILITTKKGKIGQTKLDIDFQHGWGKVTRKLKMLNSRQYIDMRYEALKNDSININLIAPTNYNYSDLKLWDTTSYTDWQKELLGGTSNYTNINLKVSGGNAIMQYLIGGTWHKETTVFPGKYDDRKGSVLININAKSANQKLSIQFSSNYIIDINRLPNVDLTQKAILLEPIAPHPFNEDGTLNWAINPSGIPTFDNPYQYLYNFYKNKTSNLISNAVLGYKILPGLDIRSSFGFTDMQTNDYNAVPLKAISPLLLQQGFQRNTIFGYRSFNSWIIEPQVNYKKNIKQFKFDLLIGATIQENNTKGFAISAKGFRNDRVLEDINSAATIAKNGSYISTYKYNAGFARLNLNYLERYVINLTGRRDGSSRFGDKRQFHNFGSVGAAWIFSEESFVPKLFPLSFGKLRMSFGTTASDQIGDYVFMNLYSVVNAGVPYQGLTGLRPNALPNQYLEWEETRKLQFGLDIGFLNDRIFLNSTYVRNRSSNQLLNYIIPSNTGFTNILMNFPATIQNTAWEIALNTVNIKRKNINWSSSFNITIPKNKVVDFPNIENTSYASGDNGVIVGQPFGIIKSFSFSGVDEATGLYQFSDGKGGVTFRPDTMQVITQNSLISTMPKLYGGIQNSFSYKSIQIDFLFQFVKQIGRNVLFYNGNNVFPGMSIPGYSNQPVTVLDRWQNPGDISQVHKFSTLSNRNLLNAVASDYFYSDASYIRLKNISITWQLPERLARKPFMSSCKIYLQGQNLLTITNYKGLDPENQGTSSLPPLKMVVMGIQLGF